MEHGDHVALFRDFNAPLVECTSVPDLKEKLKDYDCYVTPHHMGYITGFRGYNWAAFREDRQTPFVEMFSRHGLAESDTGDYDYLLKIHAPDMKYYQEFVLNILGNIDHLGSLESTFVMDEIKHDFGLHI